MKIDNLCYSYFKSTLFLYGFNYPLAQFKFRKLFSLSMVTPERLPTFRIIPYQTVYSFNKLSCGNGKWKINAFFGAKITETLNLI